MPSPISDTRRTALLSMDMQSAIVSRYLGAHQDFLPRAASVLEQARAAGLTIVHVQVGFRAGLPEISTRNSLFGAIKTSPEWQQMFRGPAAQIHPEVAPLPEEIVVTKHRVSAFTGTDLDMILRANEIETLVLFGIATSGVVLSTLIDAFDADYRLIVVKDCCLDSDADVHACLTEKFFPGRGSVLTAAELLEALRPNS
jgi:nicotinamidase-related amidase